MLWENTEIKIRSGQRSLEEFEKCIHKRGGLLLDVVSGFQIMEGWIVSALRV
jgi:hypothetical protein